MSLSADITFIIGLIEDGVDQGLNTLDSISDFKVDIKELINMIVEYGGDFGDELVDLKDVILSII
jgi:hypothetical protein